MGVACSQSSTITGTNRPIKKQELKKINLVLLGKTGSGKSATANTLLRRDAFISNNKVKSVTRDIQLECSEIGDLLVNLVDTPGLMDTSRPQEEVLKSIYNIMGFCPEGFNALLFVVPWNVRFTEEEANTLRILKNSFGPTFLKNHCIVIVTGGDSFQTANESKGKDYTFETWLKEQTEPEEFASLLQDCANRVVLFFNSGSTYQNQRESSVKKCFEIINSLSGRYTNEHFKKCQEERDKIAVELKLPNQQLYVQEELSLAKQKMQETRRIIDQMHAEKNKKQQTELEKIAQANIVELKIKLILLNDKLAVDDKGTHVMKELIKQVKETLEGVEEIRNRSIYEWKDSLILLEQKVETVKNESSYELFKKLLNSTYEKVAPFIDQAAKVVGMARTLIPF